jgi:hypothetical protein
MMVTALAAEELKRLGAAAFWPLFHDAGRLGRGPNVPLSPGWSQVANACLLIRALPDTSRRAARSLPRGPFVLSLR